MAEEAVMGYLIAVVVGLIVLILVLLLFNRVGDAQRNIVDSSICKKSVEIDANLRFDSINSGAEIKCPTLYLKLDSTDKNVVFETLALAMSDTWNEFLEGRKEVFNTATQDYCVIRRVIEFEEAEIYEGFLDYTLQNNPPNVRNSYFTYMSNAAVEDGVASLRQNPSLSELGKIDTSTPYAAIFILSKKENIGRVLGAKIGAVTGGTIGVISAGTFTYLSGGIGALASAKIVTASLSAGTYLGGAAGFVFGSSYPANWDAGMVLIPFTEENLNSLDCTQLSVAITEEQ